MQETPVQLTAVAWSAFFSMILLALCYPVLSYDICRQSVAGAVKCSLSAPASILSRFSPLNACVEVCTHNSMFRAGLVAPLPHATGSRCFVGFSSPLLSLQVMVAMELCTNGALREALKLNISWPLKVMTLFSDSRWLPPWVECVFSRTKSSGRKAYDGYSRLTR